MEHTKKMVLVDPRTLDTIRASSLTAQAPVPDAATESLRDMDLQMRDVLDRNDMNLEDKANLYQQTLWRYLKRFGQYKDKPLGTVQVKPDERGKTLLLGSETTATEDVKYDPSANEQDVLQSVPKTMRSRAERMLQRIKSRPDVTWNPRGEIEYQGQLVKDSNLTDLVNDVLRKRRNTAEPVGWKTFAAALHHLNVPQDLVGNPERWKYIREKGLQTSPPVLTPQIHPRNVALSSLKRRKEAEEEEESQGRKTSFAQKETPVVWKKTKTHKHKRKQQRFQKRLVLEDWQPM